MTYRLLRFFIKALACLPFWVLYGLSGVAAVVLHRVVRYRRKVVRRNLAECFPEKSERELRQIERKFYLNFADQIVETLKMAVISPEEISRRMKFVNSGELDTVLSAGRSVAIFMGHYGNWEWVCSLPLHFTADAVAAQIYHRLSNPVFDRLMFEMRERFGAKNIEMRRTARFINEQALRGCVDVVGFIADQSPRSKDAHYFLPFLNHRTPVLVGPEKIVAHYGFDAWFLKITKRARGYYEGEFVRMNPQERPESAYPLTDIYYHMLEQSIRRHPELYLWSHRRFRIATLLNSDANED